MNYEDEPEEVELCGQMGDGIHEYGRCKLPLGHGRGPGDDDDIHEDEEGSRWSW